MSFTGDTDDGRNYLKMSNNNGRKHENLKSSAFGEINQDEAEECWAHDELTIQICVKLNKSSN